MKDGERRNGSKHFNYINETLNHPSVTIWEQLVSSKVIRLRGQKGSKVYAYVARRQQGIRLRRQQGIRLRGQKDSNTLTWPERQQYAYVARK